MINPVENALARAPGAPDSSRVQRLGGRALVAEALKRCGVLRLIGICGTPIDAIFGEAERRDIRCIGTRHQATAALTAAAGNYLSGRLENAVLVSAGPSITNTLTSILVARDNHWPLLVMGGRRSLRNEGAGYFQELDAVPILAPITKWAATVQRASDIFPFIHRAIEVALSDNPGPVYLDLPEDVLSDEAVPLDVRLPIREAYAHSTAGEVEHAFALLRASRKPILCLGEGIRWNFDPAVLRHLVEREQLPFITTSLGRGFIPDDHPLCLNSVRHRVQAKSDLVIMIGAWFDWRFRHGAELGPDTKIIHVDPDAHTRGKNVRTALAVGGDPGAFLAALNQISKRSIPVDRSAWLSELSAVQYRYPVNHAQSVVNGAITPEQLYSALRDVLPADAFVVVDGSVHLVVGQSMLKVNRPLSWLDPGWNGLIGSGIPQALAAKLTFPERPVVTVIGDTGFGMSGMELETAVRYNVPLVVLVVNNNGVNGHRRQKTFCREEAEPIFTFQEGLRYDQVAQALGARGIRVCRSEDLPDAIVSSLARDEVTCIDVVVDPEVALPPAW